MVGVSIPLMSRHHTISPGQTFSNPVTGERFTFTHTAVSTGGELLAFDLALRPGGAVPIPHVHPVPAVRFGSRLVSPLADAPVLVLGATGKIGRRVLERLRAQGIAVRAGSRAAQPRFDWDDRSTWAPALAGAPAAYVPFSPDLAVPGAAETVAAFAALAVASGTRRLVLVSGRGEAGAERAERALQESGVAEWTIVRCSWFNQNFSESYLLDSVLDGEVALPVGDVAEPFVDADDIADVAVAALTRDGHAGCLYELTGPRLLTFPDAVAEIGAAAGRRVGFVSVSMDDYASAASAAGVPDDYLWLLRYVFEETLDGRNASLGDGVRLALGRAPRDFADYARDVAATGAWRR